MFKKVTQSSCLPSSGKQFLIVLFILSLFIYSCNDEIPEEELKVGSIAPDFTLTDLSGKTVSLRKDFKDNKVFLLFWSSTCTSCKETMTALEEVYKKTGAGGFAVIAVNVYQKRDDVEKYSKELGLTYPILLDRWGAVALVYEVYAIPDTYVLDKSGKILYKFLGDTSKEKIESIVKEFWG